MIIDDLQRKLFAAPALAAIAGKLDAGEDAGLGLAASARPLLVASVYARNPRPMLVIVSGEDAAERFARAVAAFIGWRRVLVFPERSDLPWDDRPVDIAQVGKRMHALGALASGHEVVVVASAAALLRKMAPASGNALDALAITRENGIVDVATGELCTYDQLPDQLIARGYQRLDQVDGPGTFAVHGDTVDIFASGQSSPTRIEFFGDDIDGLRHVVASTGQTIGDIDELEVWPAREYAVSNSGLKRLNEQLKGRIASDRKVADDIKKLEDGVPFADMDRYLPHLCAQPGQPIEHACADTLIVPVEPRSLFDDASRRYDKLAARADSAGIKPEELEGLYTTPAKMDFGSQQRLTLMSMMRIGGKADADLAVERPSFQGREEQMFSTMRSLVSGGTMTLLSVPDRHAREDIKLALLDNAVPFVERLDATDGHLTSEHLDIVDVDVPSGFIIPDAKLALLSLSDLSRHHVHRASAQHVDITEITFPFQPGDYVVHASHGIALFKGMVKREVAGMERDYLLLAYAAEDKLYVPVEQIGRITRYVGPNGSAPRLTRLNSADWSRATGKARASAKKLAFDLVDLYARRSSVKGFSYSADDAWQEEMEAIFPYEETPDQLKAIADVKADMESDHPMDRLICGDVGFGKTEVALRAAFKAVSDHRQVMVLCPTTILAQQHYDTFNDRFAPFGIHVEVLSRFRSTKQVKAALEGFANGTVDVLVGTHRLLSRDVNPKSLGLVVIDEEQRFGVQHKEQLKNLRESVDVLTLSATPIPRTLQMSLSGVRDMSLIVTPPANRRPVEVHVGEWDEDIVSAAIRREMERGGQVYYVSNRVKTIGDALDRVADAAPEARVGVAHGQMSAKQIEDVMEQFAAGEIDVLVATTIVESGLDNPHTNTLIIEDSQRLGLAQLYQLKGRVGRSQTQAYAYFLFPADKPLTEEATERLRAIGEFSDLGSGMKVAMRDLEIRGAGSMLGAEQSGNMSAVGFDLFASMLADAVSDARGEGAVAHEEVRVEIAADFLIPEEYIPAADERVLFYRRIAAAQTADDVDRVAEQMRETHGEPPFPASNMLSRARIKALAAECGATSVAQTGGKLVIEPVGRQLKTAVDASDAAHATMERLRALWFAKSEKCTIRVGKDDPVLEIAVEAMEALADAAEANR